MIQPLLGESSAVPAPAREQTGNEAQSNRLRGYQRGYALARDPQHRDGRMPNAEALRVIASIHSKGEGPSFHDGFAAGFAAGLTRQATAR